MNRNPKFIEESNSSQTKLNIEKHNLLYNCICVFTVFWYKRESNKNP